MSVQKCRISRGFLGSGVQKLALGGFLARLGVLFRSPLRSLVMIYAKVAARMGSNYAKLAPSWSKMRPRCRLGAQLDRFWVGFGSI